MKAAARTITTFNRGLDCFTHLRSIRKLARNIGNACIFSLGYNFIHTSSMAVCNKHWAGKYNFVHAHLGGFVATDILALLVFSPSNVENESSADES